jgi:adenylate cyclase
VRDLAEAITGAIILGACQVPDLTFGLPHPDVEAWSAYQRGALYLYQRSESDLANALALFEEATDRDPRYARAWAASVDAMYYQLALDYLSITPEWRESAIRIARHAFEISPRDAAVHCALGQGYLILRQPEAAIPCFEAAVELNPSYAWAHYGIGAAKVLSGNAKDATAHLEMAIRLSPIDRNMGSFLLRTADAYLFMRHYEEAVVWARRAIRQPLFQWSRYAVLLSALGHLGRSEEAREVLDEVLSRRPDFSLELVRSTHLYTDQVMLEFVSEPQMFVDQNEFAHYLDGLRKAGVPSG